MQIGVRDRAREVEQRRGAAEEIRRAGTFGLWPSVQTVASLASMEPGERKAMQIVVSRLHQRLPDVPVTHLEDEVLATYAEYHGSRVRDFVWILVERQVLERRREPRYADRTEADVMSRIVGSDYRPFPDVTTALDDATAMTWGLHDVGFGGTGEQAGRS